MGRVKPQHHGPLATIHSSWHQTSPNPFPASATGYIEKKRAAAEAPRHRSFKAPSPPQRRGAPSLPRQDRTVFFHQKERHLNQRKRSLTNYPAARAHATSSSRPTAKPAGKHEPNSKNRHESTNTQERLPAGGDRQQQAARIIGPSKLCRQKRPAIIRRAITDRILLAPDRTNQINDRPGKRRQTATGHPSRDRTESSSPGTVGRPSTTSRERNPDRVATPPGRAEKTKQN